MEDIYITDKHIYGIKCIQNNCELWSINNKIMLSNEMIEQITKLYYVYKNTINKYFVYKKAKNKYDEIMVWFPYDENNLIKFIKR